MACVPRAKAAVRRCSTKKLFLKISQYSQKNITGKHLCYSLFFNKDTGPRPSTLLKRDSNTGVFL